MNLDQFFNTWNGRFVEELDPTNENQCKDLAQKYVKDVLNQPYLPLGNANLMFSLAQNDIYNKYVNTVSNFPQRGDLVIWDSRYGKYGHIAIVMSANLFWFTAFEQNDPFESPCHLKRYSYFGVRGWVRLRVKEDATAILFKQVWGRDLTDRERAYFLIRSQNGSLQHAKLESTIRFWKTKSASDWKKEISKYLPA